MVLTPEQEAELRAAEDMARRLLNSRSPIPGRPGISSRSTGNFCFPLDRGATLVVLLCHGQCSLGTTAQAAPHERSTCQKREMR